MKRGPTRAFEHGTRPSDYAIAWCQWRELQCWFSRELMRKYPDVDRIFAVRDLMMAAERRVLRLERWRR